ncbi:MAG TPA: hypothetical protein VI197_25675 [Polyangiaceae bacterium]
MGNSLEILAARSGAAILGELSADVFYAGLVGHVCSGLGAKCATRLATRLATFDSAHLYCNLLLSSTFDFSARSSIVRTLIAHRRHVASMTLLVGSAAGQATAQALAATLDTGARIVTDPIEFDTLLVKAAPLAHLKLREIELTSLSGSARWRSSFAPSQRPQRPAERSRGCSVDTTTSERAAPGAQRPFERG